MTILLLSAAYLVICLMMLPVQEASLMAALACLSLLGVTKFARASSPLQAFHWFKRYPLRGAFVLVLTLSGLVLGVMNAMGLKVLVQLPLIFVWFWLFAAADTYFRASGPKQ
jgi:hypothetical protein